LANCPFDPALPAALHDVGKVSPGFQLKLSEQTIQGIEPELAGLDISRFVTDHAAIGAAAVNRLFGKRTQLSSLATIVALHHGAIRHRRYTDSGGDFGGSTWVAEREKLINELIKECGGKPNSKDLATTHLHVMAGMLCVADWIGSDETFFPTEGLPSGTDLDAAASEALIQCGFVAPEICPDLGFDEIFPFSPNAFQKAVAEFIKEPGLYILEAPMGLGKTEAALFAAYQLINAGQHHGIFFGLPTRLTSDRIHERVERFLQAICRNNQEAKLAHGTAWLKEYASGGEALRPGYAWFNPRKRRLLHPFTVGTIDQALLSVLRVKHHFVRTFALSGKVVILDEVHSYDVYTSRLINIMVDQLIEAGCTVIILSATLSAERRAAFFKHAPIRVTTEQAYPLVSGGIADNIRARAVAPPPPRNYRVAMEDWDDAAVASHATSKAEEGHCVLCIANTVARAQAWHASISAARRGDDSFEIGILHSKFPAYRRAQIEEEWLERLGPEGAKRPRGCVLIATQVVEQSVDIDADTLITELAPTDMLLQRMGRQWRHARDCRPTAEPHVSIITGSPEEAGNKDEIVDAFGKSNSFVYAPYLLWRTWDVWRTQQAITLPDEIRELIRLTYTDDPNTEPEAVRGLHVELKKDVQKLEQLANAALASVESMPPAKDDEKASTRYSDLPTTQILILKDIDTTGHAAKLTLIEGEVVSVYDKVPDLSVTRLLHRSVLNVATYWLRENGIVPKSPPWLRKHFFEKTVVLAWDEEYGTLTTWDGVNTSLRYAHSTGLVRQPVETSQNMESIPFDEYEGMDVFDKKRWDW